MNERPCRVPPCPAPLAHISGLLIPAYPPPPPSTPQTCEIGSDCPFVQGYNNLSSSVAMCESLFGIDADAVAAQIDASNAYYGGNKPAGSRILFPNGGLGNSTDRPPLAPYPYP